MAVDQFNNGVFVRGGLGCDSFTPPTACITDNAIQANTNIQATKVIQQYQPTRAQASGAAVVAKREVVHVVQGASATLVSFVASLQQACTGNATLTVDLQVNGITALTAPISFSSTDAAYSVKTAVVTTAALSANAVLEYVTTVTPGTGALGQGLGCAPKIRETPQ